MIRLLWIVPLLWVNSAESIGTNGNATGIALNKISTSSTKLNLDVRLFYKMPLKWQKEIIKPTIPPVAKPKPFFIASYIPLSGALIKCAMHEEYSLTIESVESVEFPSMMMYSIKS